MVMPPERWYALFPIETDKSGEHRIVDKRGPNIVVLGRYISFDDARADWNRAVAAAVN